MKKVSKLLLTLAAVASLAGCGEKKQEEKLPEFDINVEVTGGTYEEKVALLKAVNASIVTKNSKDALYPDSDATLKEDEGDFIRLIHTYSKGSYTTEFTWEVTKGDYFDALVKADDTADFIYPVYKGYEHKSESGKIDFTLKSAKCGGAEAKAADIKYSVKIQNHQYYYNDITIAQINSVTDVAKTVTVAEVDYNFPSTFDMVDYSDDGSGKYSPYFIVDEKNKGMEKEYYYVNVKGKVIYYSPDGNWALLADGDQVLELYAGSALNMLPTKFPYMAGEYVEVSGNLAQYCGNIQLGFITMIKPCNKSDITEPSMTYFDIDTSKYELPAPYTCHKQAINGYSNSLAQVSGTIVEGSLKDSGDAAITPDKLQNARFTFEIKQDGTNKTVQVAYDYHTDRGAAGLYDALKDALTKGGHITLKGTMRYSGNNSLPFVLNGNPGVWNIVPFLGSHVGA